MRRMARLTKQGIAAAKKRGKGMYPDGGGLYLQVTESGATSWIFRYTLNGQAREMGLGSAQVVSLADARRKAEDCRRLKADGIDPIEHRRRARAEATKSVTFKEAAQAYIAAHRTSWRNSKHAKQWSSTLEAYAYPVIGDLPVQDIDVELILKVLKPIWYEKTETASRVRGRIEAILDSAAAQGHRRGENPARWRGHLDKLLPRRSKVQQVRHQPALPYAGIGAFMKALRGRSSVAADALEFCILTATRTGEVIGCRWQEIDMEAGVWTIPAGRMKAGKEHRVPLSEAALTVLRRRAECEQDTGFAFPGGKPGKPLSNMAMLKLLQRMGWQDVTPHGFRSTFRDWAAEQTNFPREIAEAALAHVLRNKVEAAYQRGDLLERRRKLMEAWAQYVDRSAERSDVVALRASA